MPACGSPKLIAACHVLHRLLLPRHPPCALSSLTIKFTRHIQESSQPSAISIQPKTIPNTPLKLYGPLLLLIARLTPINVYAHQQLLSGTHKNLRRLVFTQSIQLSNIVLVNQLSVVSFQPSAKNLLLKLSTHPASAGMGLAQCGVCKPLTASNPMFGARRLSLNREQIHGRRG